MTRRNLLLSVGGLITLVGAALGAMLHVGTKADRPDCPGQIVCPLTGELVCKDRCPLGSAQAKEKDASEVPACCRMNAERR